jgi:hypothetical protein
MKLFVWIFVLAPWFIMAQQRVFTLKAMGGINGCQIHGDAYSGYDKIGVFMGAVVNARLSEKQALEMGFVFTQKGARHNSNPKAGDYSFYRVNLNYLEVPFLYRRLLNAKYFYTAGTSLAYLISYTEATELGNWNGVYPFNKLEVSLNAGLGYEYNKQLAIELRSNNSIAPIRSYGRIANLVFYPNPVARFFNKGLYNNVLSLIISYKFLEK